MNRIPANKPDRLPRCGKCRAVLCISFAEPADVPGVGIGCYLKKYLAWLALLGIIAAAVYVSTRPTSKSKPAPQTERSQHESLPHPQQPLP